MKFTPVTIENAHKYYNKGKSNQIHVMDNITLELPESGLVAIFGQSGCGKTTLLNAVGGLDKIASGSIRIFGQDIRENPDTLRNRYIGYIFQNYNLNMGETVYENVAFALECIGKPRAVIKTQVPETLRLVGLAEKMDNYPDQLSGGEQQRVSVARAMVNRPPLLVCDEPTGNLDPAISLGIMRLLDRINRTGTTVVMATHDREMVDSMRKRVVALEAGHIVRDQERGGYGYYGAI